LSSIYYIFQPLSGKDIEKWCRSQGRYLIGMCKYVYTYMYIYIYLSMYMFIYVYIYIYIYVYVCMYTFICLYIEKWCRSQGRYLIGMYIYVCIYLCVFYACVNMVLYDILMCIYTYILVVYKVGELSHRYLYILHTKFLIYAFFIYTLVTVIGLKVWICLYITYKFTFNYMYTYLYTHIIKYVN
jgi:hypothetical protein